MDAGGDREMRIIKLWLHCLFYFHRSAKAGSYRFCYDCKYDPNLGGK